MKRPPIGIMPRWLWVELYPHPTTMQIIQRKLSLLYAVFRYKEQEISIPTEWQTELIKPNKSYL